MEVEIGSGLSRSGAPCFETPLIKPDELLDPNQPSAELILHW